MISPWIASGIIGILLMVIGGRHLYRRLHFRPHRRIPGILLSVENGEAQVILFNKKRGEEYRYFLPYGPLEESGITVEHQPFEIEEYGFPPKYKYKPLAMSKDAFIDHISLTIEYQEKLTRILENGGNQSGRPKIHPIPISEDR